MRLADDIKQVVNINICDPDELIGTMPEVDWVLRGWHMELCDGQWKLTMRGTRPQRLDADKGYDNATT